MLKKLLGLLFILIIAVSFHHAIKLIDQACEASKTYQQASIVDCKTCLAMAYHGIQFASYDQDGKVYFIRNNKRHLLFTEDFEKYYKGRKRNE